jgi:hypothetical protein
MSSSYQDIPINSAVVDGAAAGNITVTGIAVGDRLKVVQDVAAAGENLVSEFTVTAADTINNTGGTATTGMLLLVIWQPGSIQRADAGSKLGRYGE